MLKVKNSPLELRKYFNKLKDRELRNRETKIRKEVEELFFKIVIVSIDNRDKFDEKEMMKKRPSAKCTWFNWLINYILKPTKTDGWC